MFKKTLIIGASRGLGYSIAVHIPMHIETVEELTLVSRRSEVLEDIRKKYPELIADKGIKVPSVKTLVRDLNNVSHLEQLTEVMAREDFDLVIFCAGGGPHGDFIKKRWGDHLWALQVGLLAPMRLAHAWLGNRRSPTPGRFVIVGSRIAESQADPLATSYAASKHGLVGFVSSIQTELEASVHRIWLFSPGYMDTEMLPSTAPVRHDGTKIMNPDTAAQALLKWIKKNEGPWHHGLN